MNSRFLRYVFQNVAAMIGVSVYILADTFFISLYGGANGIAFLNLVLPVYGLIFAIGAMIGVGSATRFTIKRAAGQDSSFYFLQSVFWSLLASVPFILLGIFSPDSVLHLMGADQVLTELGRTYTRIFLLFAPFFMVNYTFTAFARNDHAPTVAMIGSISGSLFNIVFDYVLMFVLDLGLAGAALATAFSPVVTMLVCSTHFLGKHNGIGFKWVMPKFRFLRKSCGLGVSAFVGELSSAVTTVVFNMLILHLAGNIGVAAYGIIANVSLVAMAIMNGIAQGTQPLLSESFGKNDRKQLDVLLKHGMIAMLVAEALIVGVIWLGTDGLIAVFNTENSLALHDYAFSGLRLYFLGFLIVGINVMLITYFAATNRPVQTLIGSLLRGVIAISLCALVLSLLFGMTGIWCALLASEIVTLVVLSVLYKKQKTGRIVNG